MANGDYRNLVHWVTLAEVPAIVDKEICYLPTRQTVYNWVRSGKLKVGKYKPIRTTRRWVLEFLENYMRRS